MSSATVTLYTGCMKSGKTICLIQDYQNAVINHKRVLAYKPKLDTRGDKRFILSRSTKTMIPAIELSLDGKELLIDASLSKAIPTLYIVDEAQFLNDVSWVNAVVAMGHSLSFSSLSNDKDGNSWKITSVLTSLADLIIHMHARCDFCGNPANFNLFQPGNNQDNISGQIVIESASNKYYPVCRSCWFAHQRK